MNNQGLTTESNYKSKGSGETCDKEKEHEQAAKIGYYETVPTKDELALRKAVISQPVSVSMDSSANTFTFYKSGIFDGDCRTELNHADADQTLVN
ncbi:hypothetical protein Pint_10429 [Pistacia integerrima]|uniref:Uncharacterized protein n=1 Tax=Pistacia integerrima TaxID=434235 RepID=A0ACC0XL46_9ROSI|nr:hypothetical protein Pint_10429 [Pistacia integerrima]